MSYNFNNVKHSSISGLFSNFTKFIFTDKVEIKKPSQLPVYLLHRSFNAPNKKVASREHYENEIRKRSNEFNRNFFQLLWFCYRRDFNRILEHDVTEVELFLSTVEL